MTKNNRWLVLAILSSALLLITLDMTVLYTALPSLTHDLKASAEQKLWIINAYPLVMAGALLGAGTLGDRIGHRTLFIIGLVVFGIASIVAGFAPSPAVLIAARVFLAIGAALMMPATLSLIRLTFDDEKERSLAIGIWAAIAGGGAALGPVLGGALLEHFWWGSVFLINVPVVIAALFGAVIFIPHARATSDRPWDLVGSLQIMVVLVAFAYAVKEFAKSAPSIPAAGIAVVIGLIAATVFTRAQRRAKHKLIDFALFSNPAFSAGVVGAIVTNLTLVGFQLAFVQRLQLVVGISPLEAGLQILPLPLTMLVAGPLAGWLLPKLGVRMVLSCALMTAAGGLLLVALSMDGSAAAQVAGLMLFGLGLGAGVSSSSSAIMASAPTDRAGMAASVEEVSFELGGAIGVAVLSAVLTSVYRSTLVFATGGRTLPDGAADSLDTARLAAESMPADQAQALMLAARQAFNHGYFAVGLASVAILVASTIYVIWRMRRANLHWVARA